MKQHSFTDFVYEVIGELRQENRFATAYIYHYALQAFTASVGGGKIFWGGLNRRSLCKFQYYLEKEQKSYNTTSTYIRALRAIYNRAVDRGVVAGECRLFVNLKTGVSSEHKLALTAGQTSRLLGDVVDGKYSSGRLSSPVLPPEVYRAQDTMRLMLLICRRQKTGTELCVKLMPQARQLIERYRSREESSPYLLDILTPTSSDREAFDDYRRCLRKLNFNLSRLPGLMGMEEVKVSSYTARHTWATLAKYCQVPEEVISEGLGHSSLEVTRTYLKSFEGEELNRANIVVNNYIITGEKGMWNES